MTASNRNLVVCIGFIVMFCLGLVIGAAFSPAITQPVVIAQSAVVSTSTPIPVTMEVMPIPTGGTLVGQVYGRGNTRLYTTADRTTHLPAQRGVDVPSLEVVSTNFRVKANGYVGIYAVYKLTDGEWVKISVDEANSLISKPVPLMVDIYFFGKDGKSVTSTYRPSAWIEYRDLAKITI